MSCSSISLLNAARLPSCSPHKAPGVARSVGLRRRRAGRLPVRTECAYRESVTDEAFDVAGDSVDEADWERASAILFEGMQQPPPPPRTVFRPPPMPQLVDRSAEFALARPGRGSAVAERPKKSSWFSKFLGKLHAAWVIFFPDVPKTRQLTARDAGMNRLKVVLIADRVGMTAASFEEMKRSIVDALGRYVELSSEGDVVVTVTQDAEIGAVYSVSVPVRRVKQEARFALLEPPDALLDADGVTVAWDHRLAAYDENNWDSDPSDRFPCGA